MSIPDKGFDLEKMIAGLGPDKSGSADAGGIDSTICAGEKDIPGAFGAAEKTGFKSFGEVNETFLTAWKTSGKGRKKRMTPAPARKGRHTSMRMRMVAGALAVIMSAGMLSGLTDTTYANSDYETISSFERTNPVYTEWADNGTAKEDLSLPETLRAVVELPETAERTAATEPSEPVFTQTAPVADEDGDYDYYWYGYVAPQEEQALRDAGELVIYTIYYADGTLAYRVHGTFGDMDEGFYACDENGEITGIIKAVSVTWSSKDYTANEAGTYTFTAKIADGTVYKGELPTAEITVKEVNEAADSEDDYETCGEEAVCTCGAVTDKHNESCELYTPECTCDSADDGHIKGCPLWNPDCTCPEGTVGHTSESCPYWVPLADCGCGIDEGSRPWEHNKGCKYYSDPVCTCEGGVHNYTNKDCLKYVSVSTFSLYGGGANDTRSDQLMLDNTPTSGNADLDIELGTCIAPGYWVDYINTIWQNKAYNKFAWTPAESTGAYNNWSWSGNTANVIKTESITTQNTAAAIPAKVSGVWTVYSGEQLVYALTNCASGDTVQLDGNINLNGSERNWYNNPSNGSGDGSGISMLNKSLTLTSTTGNNFTIYNLGVTSTAERTTTFYPASFIYGGVNLTVSNITFEAAKLVDPVSTHVGLFPWMRVNGERSYTNVEIKNSLFFGFNMVSPFSQVNNNNGVTPVYMTRCFTSGNYVYGRNHISTFSAQVNHMTVDYCGAYDNLMCNTGGHSAGFLPCGGVPDGDVTTISNCFASNELYGSFYVAGFGVPFVMTVQNCYSSGKIEGFRDLAGFSYANTVGMSLYNCYSTSLVGLRSGPSDQAGFITSSASNSGSTIKNCYAAGEVGNYDVDLNLDQYNRTASVGGFFSVRSSSVLNSSISYCYYDKQTTAMRERVTRDTTIISGITGCLTSTTNKAGTGLASGTYGSSSDTGFKGFSNNSEWVYTAEHYPQLEVFANANADQSNIEKWGSQERADAVKAWSAASTATVFLDTWDEGYDWNSDGVRSAGSTSYDRNVGTTTHKGNQYTYDTVREIVTDFTATNITANSTEWTQMIPGGAPASLTDGQNSEIVTNNIEISGGKGTVNNPGLEWYKVSETINGQTGYRPLRLIAYMSVEAGDSKNVAAGTKYNHRDDVKLTMMDTITDNLVVGLDDEAVWSTAKQGGYPDSTLYYAVPTTNLGTSFSASQNAWIYTEIWRAEKDASGNFVYDVDGNLVPEYSVKVTGSGTGSNATIDEQKWNGEQPLYPDTSASHKYIITYYWMLSDGRYRTDTKIITITPGQYDVSVNVYNDSSDPDARNSNGTALYPAAAPDSGADTAYSFGANTSNSAQTLNNTYTTNATAAWKKKSAYTKVERMIVTMYATDKTTVMGTAEITGDIKEGSTITVPVTYYYITLADDPVQGWREITTEETVNLTYTVEIDASGGYYLRFNKLANVPSAEVPDAYENGDPTGIPTDIEAYVNDLSHNIRIDLFVSEAGALTVKKVLSSPAEEEEKFVFQIDYRGNGSEAADLSERTMYAVITVPAGALEATAEFVGMPVGWYTVTELNSNWRFDLLTDELADQNPDDAIIDAANAKITMHIGSKEKTYTYCNERQNIPWASGKSSVTNDMPPVDEYPVTSQVRSTSPATRADSAAGSMEVQKETRLAAALLTDKKKPGITGSEPEEPKNEA